MKLKLALASALMALTVSSQAATYIVSNVVDGKTDVLFQAADNSLLDGGIVAIGYFQTGYSFTTSTDAVTNFTTLASALSGSPSDGLGGSFKGYVEGASVQGLTITGSNALLGVPLYVFVGNSSTLAASTAFGLQKVATFAEDFPDDLTYTANLIGAPTPVFGTVGSYTGNAGGQGSSTYATLQLAAVPEPSTTLLGAIGALALLRRRRN
jgi:hypothetical protein